VFRRHVLRLAALLAVIPVSTACAASGEPGGDTASVPSGASGSAAVVTVKDFSFNPPALTIAAGTTVTWKFEDDAVHNAVAGDKSFTSPNLSGGKTFTHTFTKAGTYPYLCTLHQYMTGQIVVT
jgi:plastocyanin